MPRAHGDTRDARDFGDAADRFPAKIAGSDGELPFDSYL
jgi:hypothetical protein